MSRAAAGSACETEARREGPAAGRDRLQRTAGGGNVWGVFALGGEGERLALPTLLLAYALVMGFVCIRYARYLVEHLASAAKISEQKDIISLLLKEFEDNSSDWLWEFDCHGCLQRVSERFAAAAGIPSEQLVGSTSATSCVRSAWQATRWSPSSTPTSRRGGPSAASRCS